MSSPSNPSFAAQINEVFDVDGMDCSEEVAAIERALKPVPGVLGVRAEIVSSKVTISHDGRPSRDDLAAAIRTAGVTVRSENNQGDEGRNWLRLALVATSGMTTGLGLLLQWFGWKDAWEPDVAFFVAILAGAALVLPKALRSLRTLTLDINVLMVVAVIGAVAIGEVAEGAAVVFLFSLSELLESWSVGRARRAIQALMELTPDTALVRREGVWVEVAAAEVPLGETILVKPGQKSALDGEVTSGNSAMDQSPITGESMPVQKAAGDTVFAGAINGEGALEVRVTKTAGNTTVARIITMVEEAQQQRAPAQRFVDVFAKIYTPAVMVLAFLLALVPPLVFGHAWDVWIYRALVMLVIACPCALVISTPVSVVSGLAAMARAGVLIKGGAYLEALASLRALAVDKTGTITEGKPRVREVIAWNETPVAEVLRVAASLDAQSNHPLAQAVVTYATEHAVALDPATAFQSVTGRGAKGVIGKHAYFVGNHRFAHELGVCNPALEAKLAEIEASALSVVVVGHQPHDECAGEVLGILAVGDTIRPEARAAIAAIHAAGIKKIVMLSGDNTRTAQAISKQAGIDEAHGDLLPEQKIEKVRELAREHGGVGMIGDGVNDAPALAAATVGFAMGAGGTDTAIETADVALMKDDLSMVAQAIRMGRRTVGVIRFNIFFSLAVKAVFLVLALLGDTSLWLAVLADTGATLLVVANALRLLRP
ncbi:MAG: heavy metal translocating P-type ATPase [Verrucomicrobia bacterium]|nr:heavy metal translocating P-type ATPase [Verrucomicrobiota bacterium]